jgi:hypothetical protein
MIPAVLRNTQTRTSRFASASEHAAVQCHEIHEPRMDGRTTPSTPFVNRPAYSLAERVQKLHGSDDKASRRVPLRP